MKENFDMDKDLRLNDKHKADISMRVIILILGLVLASYLFKILGSELFNKFITNNTFIIISNYIDNTSWANVLAYGVLGFIITLFTFYVTSNTLKLKWYEIIIILIFSMLMSFFRYMWYGPISYLFDFIQYCFVPVLYGTLTRKTNIIKNIMNALLMYFTYSGIILFNVTLCDLKAIQYTSNFIAYVLCLIEVYLFIIAFSIFIISGGKKNDKSSEYSKQEERTNGRISKIGK